MVTFLFSAYWIAACKPGEDCAMLKLMLIDVGAMVGGVINGSDNV